MHSNGSQLTAVPRVAPSQKLFAAACTLTFAVYVALLPVMQCPPLEPLDLTPIIADAAFVIACVSFGIALLRRELSWRSSRFYYALGFYAIAILLSIAVASAPDKHPGSLLVEGYVLAIAVLTFNLVRSERVLKLVLRAWLFGAGITALTAIAGIVMFYAGMNRDTNIFLSTYGTLVPGNYPRVRGLFLNMNVCCNYLSVSFLLLLAMRSVGWIGRRPAVLLGTGIIVAALFTLSLGLGGLALGVGLWMWVHYRERGHVIAARMAFLAGALIAVAFVGAMLVSPPSLYAPDAKLHLQFSRLEPSGRFLCWRDALHTAWQNKWLGKGPGSPVAGVTLLTASGEQQFLTDAHNTFLSVAAHEGLLGFAAFCTLLIFVLRNPHLRTSGKPDVVVHTAAWIGLIEALLYQGLDGSWEHTRHVWVLIGLVAALQADENRKHHRSVSLKVQSAQAQMSAEANVVMLCASMFFSPEKSALLSAALAQPLDWQAVEEEADRQCVAPIVAHVIFQHATDLVPEAVLLGCKARIARITRQNLIWLQEWLRLLQLLEESDIPVISFKGPALALTAYGSLGLREFHDLDLLVHPVDVVRAKDILLGDGYKLWSPTIGNTEESLLRSNNRQLRFTHDTRGTTVDLHWGLLHEMFSFQLEFDDVFAAAKLEQRAEAAFLALSPEHSLIYLCAHGAKDCWSNLSQLCDVAAHVQAHPNLDWHACIRVAECSGCDRLLQHTLLLTERVLELPLTDTVQQYCHSDATAVALSNTAESFLCSGVGERPGYWRTLEYHLSFAKTRRDRARLACARVFAPAEPDWHRVRLPRQLFFLYYLIRPFRFLQEQTSKLARSQR